MKYPPDHDDDQRDRERQRREHNLNAEPGTATGRRCGAR